MAAANGVKLMKKDLNASGDGPVYRSERDTQGSERVTIEAATIAFSGSVETGAGKPRDEKAELVIQARSDAGAFERLMRLHERQVLSTAWRLLGRLEDAQDAAQEVFLRLYRYLDRFDAGRPLEPWLYRVTVNVCRDFGRRRKVRQAISLEDLEASRPLESTDPTMDPGAVASLAEERRIVEEALATLAEKERAALVLRDIQGLTTAEVAEALGSSQPTVRSQICRARLKIKKFRERKLRRTQP